MILRKRLLCFSGMTLHAERRGEDGSESLLPKVWLINGQKWEMVCVRSRLVKHHDSIGAGYTDWGGWREHLS